MQFMASDEYTYSTDAEGRRTRMPASYNSQTDEGYYPLQIEGRCADCGSSLWVSCGDPSTVAGRRPTGRCAACVERHRPSAAAIEARNRAIEWSNWWSAWYGRQQDRCADLFFATQLPLLSFLLCVVMPVGIAIITKPQHSAGVGILCVLVIWPTLHGLLRNCWNLACEVPSYYQTTYYERRRGQAMFALLLWGMGIVVFSSSVAIAYFFFRK